MQSVSRRALPRRRALVATGSLLTVIGCTLPTDPGTPAPEQPEPELRVSRTPPGPATYYVSPSGSDKHSGTSTSSPWRSISKVNSRTFGSGDRILFQGGSTFSGTLIFGAQDVGSAVTPIVVSSYGTGRATINGGASDGIKLYNTAGFEIRNLVVTGSGRTSNSGSGINLFLDLPNNPKLSYVLIDGVEVKGFGKNGVVIGSWNKNAGYSNVRVTNSTSHDNGLAGFKTYAQLPFSHLNVYFGHLKAYNNTGVSGLAGPSGTGIVLGAVTGGTIERSVAYNNGALCTSAGCGFAIWAYDAEKILIQHNEAYANRTGGPTDGGGFDLDQNTRSSTVQYNYSHGNDGPGVLLAHALSAGSTSGNIVRYNISENDSRKNGNGAITIYGRVTSSEIYHNTVFVSPSATSTPRGLYIQNAGATSNDVSQVHLRNNTLYSTGGVRLLEVTSGQLTGATGLRFEGNGYYGGGVTPKLLWGSATYTSLAGWRTASGQELLTGKSTGYEGNPGLTKPGGGGTIGDADKLATLTAYRLVTGSALIDRALNLKQLFGVSVGGADFYSNALPYGVGYDVGAHEWR
jgi:hypothetical protein